MLSLLLAVSLNSPNQPQVPFVRHPKMAYIENGVIKLGVDLNLGGSITYLAPISHPEKNLVNSSDLGRQIQLSYYSGPVPYHPKGATISKSWQFLGWNPIQSGDYYGNSSKILSTKIGKDRLTLRCIPMHWPLKNVPGECECEVSLQLEGAAVKAKCRLFNKRDDDLTQYSARAQELPAVYVNAPYYHLMTYTGSAPWAQAPLTEIHNRLDMEQHWATWLATENWAAQVDDHQWGLGVWNTGTARFSGGFFGEPGVGGPDDGPTGYIAPNRTEILDHNIVYDYNYVLVVGSLKEIRTYIYNHAKHDLPVWNFNRTREGWSYEKATDKGWPLKGGLDFAVANKFVHLVSPEFALPLANISAVTIQVSCSGSPASAELMAKTSRSNEFSPITHQPLSLMSDGKLHTYRIQVKPQLSETELLNQLKFSFKSDKETSLMVKLVRIEK